MPLFNIACQHCGQLYEMLVRIVDMTEDVVTKRRVTKCRYCDVNDAQVLPSAPNITGLKRIVPPESPIHVPGVGPVYREPK
jgi:hypothetical protein